MPHGIQNIICDLNGRFKKRFSRLQINDIANRETEHPKTNPRQNKNEHLPSHTYWKNRPRNITASPASATSNKTVWYPSEYEYSECTSVDTSPAMEIMNTFSEPISGEIPANRDNMFRNTQRTTREELFSAYKNASKRNLRFESKLRE